MKIFRCFNIDKQCLVDSIITKQMVYDAGDLNTKEKDIFVSEVSKMVWEYSLKEENTGFKAYKDEKVEYDEVEFIKVILKEKKQYKKIASILQNLMPYPIVLVFEYNDEILINTALKRINKNDDNKNTLEEITYSEWFSIENKDENEEILLESLNIKNILVNDFYMLYKTIEKSVLVYNTSLITGIIINSDKKNLEDVKILNEKIESLDKEIRGLEIKRDKEKQLNKRIDYQMQIKKLNINRKKLIKETDN